MVADRRAAPEGEVDVGAGSEGATKPAGSARYWEPVQVPEELFDLIPSLSGTELKLLLYFWRTRFGWNRPPQALSLDEIQFGQRDRDGSRLDRGTGLRAFRAPLERLIRRGYIEGGPNVYRLRVKDPEPQMPLRVVPRRELPSRNSGSTLTRLRRLVFQRDGGLCVLCAFDIGAEETALRELYALGSLVELEARLKALEDRGFTTAADGRPRSLWDLDHVVPLIEGGSHELSNLRTLCVPCHKATTVEAAQRRAGERRRGGS